MFNGSIYVTSDIDMALNLSTTHTIICVSGETDQYQDFIRATNASIGTILLPPYEAVAAKLDGNIEQFNNVYVSYLSQSEPLMFMSIVLRALYNGKNILLYITKDELQMGYMNTLAQYFRYNFGIIFGSEHNQYYFDHNYLPQALSIMYMNDLMTGYELLSSFPPNIDLRVVNVNMVSKLAIEISPYIESGDMDSYANYFNSYINNINKYNKDIIIPIRKDVR